MGISYFPEPQKQISDIGGLADALNAKQSSLVIERFNTASSQTLSANTTTLLQFTVYDDAWYTVNASDPTKIILKNAGFYLLMPSVWSGSGVNVDVMCFKNGSQIGAPIWAVSAVTNDYIQVVAMSATAVTLPPWVAGLTFIKLS